MPPVDLSPLAPDEFGFAGSPPEFLDLARATLGDLGTLQDGYEAIFAELAVHHAQTPPLITALKLCFEPAPRHFADFSLPWEAETDQAIADTVVSVDNALLAFDDLFIVAPAIAPAPAPGAPPPVPAASCPPGFIPSPFQPNACVSASSVGPAGGIFPLTPPKGVT